jgi:hypothetical protein
MSRATSSAAARGAASAGAALRFAAVLLLAALPAGLAACDRAEKPPPPAGPPTGECAGQRDGSGPVGCPYGPAAGGVDGPDYAAAFERGGDDTCLSPGALRLTSGKVVATDPLVFLEAPAFTTAFPPGQYPVTFSMVDGDVAYALLRIADERPVRWALALRPGEQAAPGEELGYPVDAGTGSYMDDATARLIEQRERQKLDWAMARVKEAQVSPADATKWRRMMDHWASQIPDLLDVLRAEGYQGANDWANVCVDPATGANLIAFGSGAGDGVYPVYVGYGAAGAPVAMVTDFRIGPIGGRRHPWIEGLDARE